MNLKLFRSGRVKRSLVKSCTGIVMFGDVAVWFSTVTSGNVLCRAVKDRFNLLIKVEPIFMHIKKSHTSHTKRDFLFIRENENGCTLKKN